MHNLLGTSEKVADLLAEVLRKSESSTILDLCSGSGGPMPEVLQILQNKHGLQGVTLTLTDLYPDHISAGKYNSQKENNIIYQTVPVDATQIDNSIPIGLWWIAIPINIIMTFFITPMIRPMNWQQLFFTYIIPIIPICFGWDGAVSNARTYTLDDLDKLLEGLESDDYSWEKGTIEGKSRQIYLLGYPS